jgi:hypothetical protein
MWGESAEAASTGRILDISFLSFDKAAEPVLHCHLSTACSDVHPAMCELILELAEILKWI